MADELESSIESKFKTYVESRGGVCLKLTPEGQKGWPDRLVVYEGGHFFIELKRKGKEPRKLQWYRINKLKRMRHAAFWTDNIEEAKRIYNREVGSS